MAVACGRSRGPDHRGSPELVPQGLGHDDPSRLVDGSSHGRTLPSETPLVRRHPRARLLRSLQSARPICPRAPDPGPCSPQRGGGTSSPVSGSGVRVRLLGRKPLIPEHGTTSEPGRAPGRTAAGDSPPTESRYHLPCRQVVARAEKRLDLRGVLSTPVRIHCGPG